ncbi:unnamed protein product [Gulo gulo]|uniref:Uncharacterized protein n=1 Tax=Gulo gulo TaxID=48420 RepID=A0A9X9M761_GULGU|nr:unnamed protein product [Gulo gulo]
MEALDNMSWIFSKTQGLCFSIFL